MDLDRCDCATHLGSYESTPGLLGPLCGEPHSIPDGRGHPRITTCSFATRPKVPPPTTLVSHVHTPHFCPPKPPKRLFSKTTLNTYRYMAAPLALLLCLAMLTLSLAVPAELTTEILLSVLFWAGNLISIQQCFEEIELDICIISPAMIGVTIFTMKRNGPDYVDQPKYIPILKRSIF